MVNKRDKNKPMRLIKENKEIIEMSVLNKPEISKSAFGMIKNKKVYIGYV